MDKLVRTKWILTLIIRLSSIRKEEVYILFGDAKDSFIITTVVKRWEVRLIR